MKGRVESMSIFRQRLLHLRDQVEMARESTAIDIEDAAVMRPVAVEALAAVCEFVEGVGWGRDNLTGPYLDLMIALQNVHSGRSDALFTPTHLDGRAPMSATKSAMRGRVAAVQERLMSRCGYRQNDAATLIFRALGADRVSLLRESSRTQPSPRTISRWRDETIRSPLDSPIRGGWRAMGELLDGAGLLTRPEGADGQAKRALAGLRRQMQSTYLARQFSEKG